jgi:ABC-type Fe3+ transport system permease subunit
MIRPAHPIMHLAEQTSRPAPRTSASGLDSLFLATIGLSLIGGCFLLLDMGASYSHGQTSMSLQFLSEASVWLPAAATAVGKYLLLLLASVLNSGVIVLLVQSLRKMDQKLSRLNPRFHTSAKKTGNVRGKRAHLESQRAHQRREASAIRESSPFLLSPVFR